MGGYAGYPYTYGAYPYATYAAPAVAAVAAAPAVAAYAPYTYALPTATAQVSPSASLTTLGLADASIPAVTGGYAGAGRYVANSAGVVHVAKRSADAEPEADAAYLYGGYGYGAFGGAYPYGLGYNGFAGYPYGYPAVGYSAYYGKRSADAEPEADAYYGYYGYGAYPYAGYGYSAYRPYGYGRSFYYY